MEREIILPRALSWKGQWMLCAKSPALILVLERQKYI